MRLIDADALMIEVENEFEGYTVYDVPPSEAVSDFEHIVDRMPTIAGLPNFDLRVNAVFDRAISGRDLYFRETDEMCPVCKRDLEVYYCENRTYAVRCKHCHIVTLVQAKNQYEAAEKVGLHVKLVRHGRWIKHKAYVKTAKCSECKTDFTKLVISDKYPNYCPNCGAKMYEEG